MYKRFLVGVFAVVALSGCVNMDTLSGDTYSADQAKRVQTVTYGTVMSARPVTIQGGSDENILGAAGGAILGGILGSTIGGGTGQTLATAAGAIACGVAGQNGQAAINNTA
ncbi:glycine zipper 2TM domain-containing protein, partial [Morganella morganii]|uniref:glycine zipper 2TM domain-containing protein n=1 Tax=Morganella morganii TaxID=582 RepID=UPI0021D1DE08